ncbi:MAG: type II toxin-antitoxin system RatA family toxin [Pseudomonadota bacterium]
MPRHATSTLVPYRPQQMFDLVSDVERYPEFIPWCRALRVVSRDTDGGDEIVIADMMVGYRMFRETFRSKVRLNRSKLRIDTDYVRGPLRDLKNLWMFEDHEWTEAAGETQRTQSENGAIVHFAVSFTLRNPILQRAAVAAFDESFARMSEAFVDRAASIYGMPEHAASQG